MFGPKTANTALAAKVKTANIEFRIAIIEVKKGVVPSQARPALRDDIVIGTEIATNGAEIKEMVIDIAAKEEMGIDAITKGVLVAVIETRKPKNELEQVGPPTNPSDLELLLL